MSDKENTMKLASEIELRLFNTIHAWNDEFEATPELKRYALGLILLRLIGCVLATEGKEEQVDALVQQFCAEIPKSTKLAYEKKALPNPLSYLENECITNQK